jgi:hypothetical protein
MPIAEIYGGISSFKAMFDMAKALKDIDNATARNGAVIELQEQILSAQAAQTALLDRVRELEEKVAGFEKWDTEKDKYELKDLGRGALAYMLKPPARGTEPPHVICPNCYENRKRAILQGAGTNNGIPRYHCLSCKSDILTGRQFMTPHWID